MYAYVCLWTYFLNDWRQWYAEDDNKQEAWNKWYHRSVSCIDSEGRLRTKLYDKRDGFNFPIVNFPFICSNIPADLHMEWISLNWPDILELVVPIRISLIRWRTEDQQQWSNRSSIFQIKSDFRLPRLIIQ